MHKGRTGATATVIPIGPNAGEILIAGGFNAKRGPLASSELYDPATNRFTPGPNLSDDAVDRTATVIGSGPRAGWILIARPTTVDLLTSLYDPVSTRFVAGPAMKYERSDHTATVIPFGPNKGKILYAGGVWDSPEEMRKGIRDPGTQTELYDPLTNRFELGPRMNTGRDSHTATVIPAGRNAGKILLVGGFLTNSGLKVVPLASTELYDPKTNTFAGRAATAILNTARGDHTATVMSSGPNAGKILIAGGEQDDRHLLSSTELYNPDSNSFVPGPPMLEPRSQHIAITIRSGPNAGDILIAGGLGIKCDKYGCGTVLLSSTELYDPESNTFVPGPAMRGAPGDVVAVQLPAAPLR